MNDAIQTAGTLPRHVFVARGHWIMEGRLPGDMDNEQVSVLHVNVFFYETGTAGINILLPRDVGRDDPGSASWRIDLPAPIGDQLRAAMFRE